MNPYSQLKGLERGLSQLKGLEGGLNDKVLPF